MIPNILLYILLSIISIIICIFLFIRVYYRFWCRQPIFHIWDLFYYIKLPGVIESNLPPLNKFCDLHNINLINYNQLEEIKSVDFQKLVYFVQNHLNQKYTINNLSAFLKNHHKDSYYSTYTKPIMLKNYKKDYMISDQHIKGSLIIRPIHITIGNTYISPYFIDLLCIDKSIPTKEKSNIRDNLLQTSIYKHSQETKKHHFYLIKNEKTIPGLVPWIQYKVYSYYWKNYLSLSQLNPTILKSSIDFYNLTEINQYNLNLILSTLKSQKKMFDCTTTIHLSNLYNLIKSNMITIYALIHKHNSNVLCIYIYRSNYSIQNTININLCSSINTQEDTDIFFKGFLLSSRNIMKKFKIDFLSIENISNNNVIINNIHILIRPYKVTHIFIYFYNYASKSINANDFFAIY